MSSDRKKIYILMIALIALLSLPEENLIAAKSSESIFDRHDLIVCGEVVAKNNNGYEEMSVPIYTIKIENYYKGSSSTVTLDAIGSEDSNGPRAMSPINVGQRAIFYVNLIGEKSYLSPYTTMVPKCATTFVPTPLGQYRFGVSSQNVYCINENVLVIKNSNSFPACVKLETKEKLIERGWAKPI